MQELILLLVFVGGVVAGSYGSVVGGGSLVMFPLLIFSGLPTAVAIATNRFTGVCLELSSSIKFFQGKKIDLKTALFFGVIVAIGSVIGANIVMAISEKALNIVIALVFSIASIIILKNKNIGKKSFDKKISKAKASVFLFGLGIYGGFFGAGFGTFCMLVLLLLGFSFVKSAATARVIGFCMSFVSMMVFAWNGLIDWHFAIAGGLGTALGFWIGAGIALKKGDAYVRKLFIIIIIATVIKLLIDFF